MSIWTTGSSHLYGQLSKINKAFAFLSGHYSKSH